MTTTYYKIRKKGVDGVYVKGTPVYHNYDGTGRIFQSLGALRTFLTGVMNNTYKHTDVSEWEVVELETIVREVKEVHEVITAKRLTELLKK